MSQPFQQALQEKQQLVYDALQSGSQIEPSFWITLRESEDQLIQLMNTPTPPGPDAKGNIEFGWALYFLNNSDLISESLREKLRKAGMPTSDINDKEWSRWWEIWQGKGVLLGDGSLVSTATCAVMDPGWSLALIGYLLVALNINPPRPLAHNPATLNIDPDTQKSLKIALFGDWGTGKYRDGNLPHSPSQLVMQQMAKAKPDIMIHLGDVYYAGLGYEEQWNLLDCWESAALGNFTLNSNHEMYDGAKGLYHTALASPIFEKQQGTTYFSIAYGDWVVLGLDSAYNATGMYMDGAINDPYQPGPDGFIARQAKGKKVIVLTHHNPMDVQGRQTNTLWTDVVTHSLNGKHPEVWYWGHIHNAVVYSDSAPSGATKARCLGHGGIPFGHAQWLVNAPHVDYYANTPLEKPVPRNELRVKNGFAILEIKDGELTETWYDQDGKVAWSTA
ncbi:metallophosphoesterase [Flavobacteriaceae bacterium 3-367]